MTKTKFILAAIIVIIYAVAIIGCGGGGGGAGEAGPPEPAYTSPAPQTELTPQELAPLEPEPDPVVLTPPVEFEHPGGGRKPHPHNQGDGRG